MHTNIHIYLQVYEVGPTTDLGPSPVVGVHHRNDLDEVLVQTRSHCRVNDRANCIIYGVRVSVYIVYR